MGFLSRDNWIRNGSSRIIESKINCFADSTGTSYIEGISHGETPGGLMIVQHSKFDIPPIERPKDRIVKMLVNCQGVFDDEPGNGAIGAGVKRLNEVRLCGASPSSNLGYNKTHSNYLLVLELNSMYGFRAWLDNLPSLSNAAAILILIGSNCFDIFTHLKGAVRELGKPILVALATKENVERLEQETEKGKFLFYANEFEKDCPQGFLAKIS